MPPRHSRAVSTAALYRHSRGGYALTRKPPGDAFGLAGH
ncbi:hypothetical protein LTSEGIV_3357 [Salmonella enterica subsp. enterica serovar Give str. S5-487]|nr:hypothetical protein LTSEGIV_3357 [Salmonella enterica subsp. enterica serovar Give str. S5-487]